MSDLESTANNISTLIQELREQDVKIKALYDAELQRLNRELSIALDSAKPRWISVKDRLPPSDASWVLVYADGAMNCMGYTPGKGFEDWGYSPCHNINIERITHWMPLPNPPSAVPVGDVGAEKGDSPCT